MKLSEKLALEYYPDKEDPKDPTAIISAQKLAEYEQVAFIRGFNEAIQLASESATIRDQAYYNGPGAIPTEVDTDSILSLLDQEVDEA